MRPVELKYANIGLLLADRAEQYQSKPCYAEKQGGRYVSTSWRTLWRRVESIGRHWTALGLKPGDRVAVLSENRGEMLAHDLAGMTAGLVVVPIFSGYYPDQVAFILDHAEPRVLTVSTIHQFEKILTWPGRGRLLRIYVMDPAGMTWDDRVRPFAECLQESDAPQSTEWTRVGSDDPCLIMYTSGTTGHPKGVVLTHRNILSQQQAVDEVWEVSDQDTFLSYLPWHHSFGGLFERFMALYQGATLYLDESRGKNIHLMLENWKLVYPSIFFSVPKVYQALMAEAGHSTEVEHALFHPKLRFVFTAAAPLSDEVANVFSHHGIPVHEGWGLTETSPDITLTRPGYRRVSGIVGWPLPGVEVRLSGEGEILARGPNIMKGYYRDPELTAQVLETDGWFHTGDLGEWTEHGMRIVGRVDGIFKLSNAEKVCPDRIEKSVAGVSRLVLQCVAVGSGRDDVGLLLFLNWREVELWLSKRAPSLKWQAEKPDDLQRIAEQPLLLAQLTEDLFQANRSIQIKYERAKRFMVMAEELTLERGELTPTMKVVRRKVLAHYQWAVQALYEGQPGLSRKNVGIVPMGS